MAKYEDLNKIAAKARKAIISAMKEMKLLEGLDDFQTTDNENYNRLHEALRTAWLEIDHQMLENKKKNK